MSEEYIKDFLFSSGSECNAFPKVQEPNKYKDSHCNDQQMGKNNQCRGHTDS